MKNKNKQQKHVKQSNKTRLTQKKSKTLKLCKTKNQEEREEVIESLGAFFRPHLGRTFPLSKPLNLW